jgi:HlyD family secretion protein
VASIATAFPQTGRGSSAPAFCLALCLAALTACSSPDDSLPALGTLERDRIELAAEASEPIVSIDVREGHRVIAGQVLLQLDSATFDARLDSARAQVSSARHRLAELTQGPRAEEILQARARLEGAESRAQNAAREYERLTGLVAQKLVSQSALDQQRTAREAAEASQKEARAQVALLLKGTRIEELDRARDDLKRTEAELLQLEISAARLTVKAPVAGVVESLPFELGERPPAGAAVALMLADGETYARVYVPETLRVDVKAGTAAQVHVDGRPNPYSGTVRFISSEAAFTPYFALTQKDRGRLSYLAEVVVTGDGTNELPAGMPVEVFFNSPK